MNFVPQGLGTPISEFIMLNLFKKFVKKFVCSAKLSIAAIIQFQIRPKMSRNKIDKKLIWKCSPCADSKTSVFSISTPKMSLILNFEV